jgi:apolipoprotein N-acyltransferase
MSSTSRDFLTVAQPQPEIAVTPALRLALALVSPLALALAYPKVSFGPLALVAIAPLFLLWAKSSWREALLWGWLSGIVFFFVICFWMTNSLGDYIGGWKLLAGVLIAALEGLSFAATAALTALACRGSFGDLAVFAAPSAWLLAETVRTRGAFGVPFGELGLSAASVSWLLPLAAFGGVYGLTAIIALANGAIAGLVGGTTRGRIAGAYAIAVLAAIVGAGDFARARVEVPPPRFDVAIAQGDISQREKWSPGVFEHTMTVYADLTRTAAARGALVVVWPETAITSFPLQDPALLGFLERLAAANRISLFAGAVDRPHPDELYNSVISISDGGALDGHYDKHILVPFAEYLPFEQYLRGLPLFDEASRFSAGPGPSLLHAGGMRFGVLVCYESAFSPYAREVANAGADAMVIVTDDAWFGDTNGPYQHADIAVIDAVETGRWVVRGADTGISEVIDPKGRIVAKMGLDQEGVVSAKIGPPIDAPYLRFGSIWWLLLGMGALGVALLPQPSSPGGWRSKRGRA